MKKITCILLLMVLVISSLSACGSNEEGKNNISNNPNELTETNDSDVSDKSDESIKIDVDLASLSSTMVYAELFNIVKNPDNYIGKMVRIKGNFSLYTDPNTNKQYFAVIVSDATACCSQGLEFRANDKFSYPEDYPEVGGIITVEGEFTTYDENGSLYCELINANVIND